MVSDNPLSDLDIFDFTYTERDFYEIAKWSEFSQRYGIDLNMDGSVDPYIVDLVKKEHEKKRVKPETPSLDFLFAKMIVAERSRIMTKADLAREFRERELKKSNKKKNRGADSSVPDRSFYSSDQCVPYFLQKQREIDELCRILDRELGIQRHFLPELGRTRQQTAANQRPKRTILGRIQTNGQHK